MYENLFRKGKIGRLELKNRFVMPPMDSGMTEENGEDVYKRQVMLFMW